MRLADFEQRRDAFRVGGVLIPKLLMALPKLSALAHEAGAGGSSVDEVLGGSANVADPLAWAIPELAPETSMRDESSAGRCTRR